MRFLTLRGWIVAVITGALAATVTFLGLLQIRHWMVDEAQLHQIVQLIQSGQIRITPITPPAPAALPAPTPGK